jgi:hypothetical protein
MRIQGKSVRRLWCALLLAGTAVVMLSNDNAIAQEQGVAQKPTQSYQTLYLTNSSGQHDANEIQTLLRNMLPQMKVYYVGTGNAISVRGSVEDISMAEKILADVDRPRKAYRLTYTITDTSGQGGGQHWVVVATQGGGRVVVKQGSRIPVMTGSYSKESGQNQEIQYMDIGMTIQTSINGAGEGLRLESKVEQTSVADEKSNVGLQDPVIRQSVLEGESAITPGKPTVLGSIEAPSGGRKMEVSVVAEALK